MRPPARTTRPAERDARRAEALIERLRIGARSAVGSLDLGDASRLRRFMRERDAIFTSLQRLMPAVDRLGDEHPLRRSILAALRALEVENARLAAELDRRKGEVTDELVGIRQGAHSSAYRPTPAVGLALDLTR